MKKVLFSLLFFSAFASAAGTDFPDGEWYYGFFSLKINHHPPFKGYHYSLSYTLPDNMVLETDMCNASSSTQLQCITNDNVVLEANNHSVVLNNKYTYYEKGYEPNPSPLVGHWKKVPGTVGCSYTDIYIPYTQIDASVFNEIRLEEDGGYSTGVTFYLKPDTRGNLYFGSTPDYPMMGGFYLYDNEDHQINDIRNIKAATKLMPSDRYGKEITCTMAKVP